MKRIVCLFLLICLVLTTTHALAATNTISTPAPKVFDFKQLEGKDGYEYDKFEGSWSYYKAYIKEYRDATVVIGLQIEGNDDGPMPPYIYCWIRDENNRSTLEDVTGIKIMIGDDVYDFQKVVTGDSSSSVLIGADGKELLQAMANASSITVRLVSRISNTDIEISSNDYRTTLKIGAQTIVNTNIWDYVDTTWLSLADYYMYIKR